MTDDETITVCVTFAGGCPDDYQVFWRSVPIGRIMKTTGYPTRDAQWSWVISLPRESGDWGTGDNLADCEAKLGRALARLRADVAIVVLPSDPAAAGEHPAAVGVQVAVRSV